MIGLVAAAYYLSGRLGLLLAIPPGYATAVWPASGIALAAVLLAGYRVWPGIWIGSFCINVWTGLDPGSLPALLQSAIAPALIASGASLQACLGGWLIQRFVGFGNLLAQEMDAVKLLILGGPLGCVVSPSVGVATLYFSGVVPAQTALFNWWTWWVGDSIGVLIFTPLVLVWSVRPVASWLRRQLLATLPLIVMFALVVWLFVVVSGHEQTRMRSDFENWADGLGVQLQNDVDEQLKSVHAVAGFIASSTEVTRAKFGSFCSRVLAGRPAVQTLSWNPLVVAAGREEFEARVQAEGLAGLPIRELRADGELQAAAPRRSYVPVEYIAPLAGNERALGFDVASESRRRAALMRARDSGSPAATGRIELVQGAPGGAAVLVVMAVYRHAQPQATIEQRRLALRGYAAAALRIDDILGALQAGADSRGAQLAVFGEGDAGRELLFGAPLAAAGSGLRRELELRLADRRWQLHIEVPGAYLVANRSWQAWTLLASGMMFTGLLGMFLLVVIGRGTRVAQLVDQRTAQLQALNRRLAAEVARSDRLEGESRRRAQDLEASNSELEQFAYAVSHDLQAPLRNIASFAALLARRQGSQLDAESLEFLGFIRGCAGDMRRLIEDLLQLSRVSQQGAHNAPVEMQEALHAATELLRSDIDSAGGRVESGPLPVVIGDARLLTQLLQNLIGNGIKFRQPGVAPVVQVEAEPVGTRWRFAVRDNGIGIAPENRGRLFQIFKRLHTADQYPGTGIGLALCKKIVQLHGGEIWVESGPGEGTAFFFTLPAAGARGAVPAGAEQGRGAATATRPMTAPPVA